MPGRAGRNKAKDPFFYWNNVARTKPEAQTLATRLGLDFPTDLQDTPKSGLMYIHNPLPPLHIEPPLFILQPAS